MLTKINDHEFTDGTLPHLFALPKTVNTDKLVHVKVIFCVSVFLIDKARVW